MAIIISTSEPLRASEARHIDQIIRALNLFHRPKEPVVMEYDEVNGWRSLRLQKGLLVTYIAECFRGTDTGAVIESKWDAPPKMRLTGQRRKILSSVSPKDRLNITKFRWVIPEDDFVPTPEDCTVHNPGHHISQIKRAALLTFRHIGPLLSVNQRRPGMDGPLFR